MKRVQFMEKDMIEKFDLDKFNIPYGVLHDQKLESVMVEEHKMIFKFKIEIYKEDLELEIYNKYKDYEYCEMIVEMSEEPFNYFRLQSCPNNCGKYKGIIFSREDFLDIVNDSIESTFIECSATYGEFGIELCTMDYQSKKYRRKYKKYDIFHIVLDAKNVTWKWY